MVLLEQRLQALANLLRLGHQRIGFIIRQPLEEMGRSATRLLLKYIAHPNAEIERLELPTRESCQALSS